MNNKTKIQTLFLSVFLFSLALAPALGLAKAEGSDSTILQLKAGNTRFLTGEIRKDGAGKDDIERLSKGQKPKAIVLSCSDSRVPPEIVFDQKLGEIFTVRTAGEALSPPAIGTMEYAIEHLGARVLVVMGHTNCGAVKAAVETLDGKSAGSENLDQLVRDIHPRIRSMLANKKPSENLAEESWANARAVALDLSARSKIIAEAVKTGKVKIQVALYNLANGKVDFEP